MAYLQPASGPGGEIRAMVETALSMLIIHYLSRLKNAGQIPTFEVWSRLARARVWSI